MGLLVMAYMFSRQGDSSATMRLIKPQLAWLLPVCYNAAPRVANFETGWGAHTVDSVRRVVYGENDRV